MNDLTVIDVATLLHEAARQTWPVPEDHFERHASYRLALGKETIQLGIVEFRILLFSSWRAAHTMRSREEISPLP